MPESFWESEAVEEMQPEQEALHEVEPQKPEAESGNLALSLDEFSALEERILRAVDLVKRERVARTEAEERAATAEAKLLEQAPQVERLQKEVNTLHVERDHVRQRVERLLAQLDALEL
jgi:FtsZ-binding cell division protein ZapB